MGLMKVTFKPLAELDALGARWRVLQRELDTLFAEKRATPSLVDGKLAEPAVMQARYRGSRLKTHIEATKLLTPEQVARYDALRGYAGGAASPAHGHGELHPH